MLLLGAYHSRALDPAELQSLLLSNIHHSPAGCSEFDSALSEWEVINVAVLENSNVYFT
jgi:hypothetical protein